MSTGPDTRSKRTGSPAVLFVLVKVRTLPKGTLVVRAKGRMLCIDRDVFKATVWSLPAATCTTSAKPAGTVV